MSQGQPLLLYAPAHGEVALPRGKLTDEELEYACEHIANGGSTWTAARELRTTQATLWRGLTTRARVSYARALATRGTLTAESLYALNQDVAEGRLEPKAANVISGNLQWLAERQDAKRWGKGATAEAKASSSAKATVTVIVQKLPDDA